MEKIFEHTSDNNASVTMKRFENSVFLVVYTTSDVIVMASEPAHMTFPHASCSLLSTRVQFSKRNFGIQQNQNIRFSAVSLSYS